MLEECSQDSVRYLVVLSMARRKPDQTKHLGKNRREARRGLIVFKAADGPRLPKSGA